MRIRSRLVVAIMVVLAAAPAALAVWQVTGHPSSLESSLGRALNEARALAAEGSYALALERLSSMDVESLDEEGRRWLLLYRADNLWRSVSGDRVEDPTELERAREMLRELIDDRENREDQDRLWAEANESLGDSFWLPRFQRNWGAAWEHYSRALSWWAESKDIEVARERYLAIVWKISESAAPGEYWHRTPVPREILENAVRIATTQSDRARASLLLATHLSSGSDPREYERIRSLFEAALTVGRGDESYDDALFQFAMWLEQRGRLQQRPDGSWYSEGNAEEALKLYRRLVAEFPRGTSPWTDRASERIRAITEPSLQVAVSNVFLPGSDVSAHLSARNVSSVELSLWKVDLTRDVNPRYDGEWLSSIDLAGATRIRSWTRAIDVPDRHAQFQEIVRLEDKVPAGAYVLEARGGAQSARELILVTDVAVVTRSAGNGTLVYVTHAHTGAPVGGARVRGWFFDPNRRNAPREITTTTSAEGTSFIESVPGVVQRSAFIAVASGDRQAFVQTHHWSHRQAADSWKILAVTDRPAYRPSDTVQWKITARVSMDERYRTPAGERLHYRIVDPMNSQVAEGVLTLNEFGSAWSELPLSGTASLGMYRVVFARDAAFRAHVGAAALFRVEEYKLPEFRVTVEPQGPGKPGDVLRPGSRVNAVVEVEYYFGGPVRNAEVAVVVRQRPYHVWWSPRHDFDWYRTASMPRPGYFSQGEEIFREVLTTDGEGRAVVSFEVPRDRATAEYEIEARVTDASRREIVGTGSVRVSDVPFFARLTSDHPLYRPGSRATITLEAKDANDRPLQVEGQMRITRERWRETWLDPDGRRVEGEALERARRDHMSFPPRPNPDTHPWRLIHRGYDREEIDTVPVATGADGTATFQFTPREEGFYRFVWNGNVVGIERPSPQDTVTAETTIWVATNATRRIGYQPEGLEIIADPGSLRAGMVVPVLIVAPSSGHHVLFSVETGDILEHRVVEMTASARVIEVSIDERFVPNVFISAVSVRDLQLNADLEELIVPPVERFLDVQVSSDAEEYNPGDEGTITVTARDHAGNPVAAEVTLAVTDESVFYIQQELSADPREFFFGSKRPHSVQMGSSLYYKPYALAEDDEAAEREEGSGADVRAKLQGVVGGVVGRADSAQNAVAESITVTASAPQVAPPAAPPPPPVAAADGMQDVTGEVRVRTDFRATALWKPDLITDASGTATVRFRYPDTLTTWRATAHAASTGNEFGVGRSSATTSEPLTVRLQGPRFFVAGDVSTLSALIGNHTDAPVSVSASIAAEGLEVGETSVHAVSIAPGEEHRVDWAVEAREAGEARIRVTAAGSGVADAMERTIPVYEHGIEKLIAASGRVPGTDATIRLEVPAARREGSTTMEVQLAPSIAATMLDALPYLIEFPYGCTEQTMSRFLPAAIVARTLEGLDLDRDAIATRMFGGVEAGVAEDRPDRGVQMARLDAVTAAGLSRLYDMQKSDGSWGWWKDGDSDPWMTAYVVWGFALAREGGIRVREDSLVRAVQWLSTNIVNAERDPDLHAWMLHALTYASDGDERAERAFRTLYDGRDRLSSYGRALLALSAERLGHHPEAATLVRNLENAAIRDEAPDTSVLLSGGPVRSDNTMATVHWGSRPGHWWRWYESPVESTAFVLRALVTIDPQHRLVEPAMNWLVRNRRGAQWSNTRDTAIAVLALDAYLQESGELASAGTWTVTVNGTLLETRSFSARDVLAAPSVVSIPIANVRDGVNQIVIRRTEGTAPIYFAAEARYFSLEEPVTPAGNELFVKREYWRIVPRPTLLAGFVEERVPFRDGESLETGERVEVVVTVETKNDYEYLIFEDLKPAGLEAVEIQSGDPLTARRLSGAAIERRFEETTATPTRPRGEDLRARRPAGGDVIAYRNIHQELRDRKVALFADRLEQGVWEIRYQLRAEVPGRYHALPLTGQAMYVPEIRANGEEVRLAVTD